MAFANVIHDAPPMAFDYLIYPEQHPANQTYIVNQLDAYTNMLLDTGRQYFDQARQLYEQIHNADVMRAAKAALRMAKGITRPNVISPLTTVEELRTAPMIMQRYIMAEQNLRELYQSQRCDGYHDTYTDYAPHDIGFGHVDYMKVMNGIVEEIEDEGEDSWKVSLYTYDSFEGDVELTMDQQVDVLITWEAVKQALQAGYDCTDVYGGRL